MSTSPAGPRVLSTTANRRPAGCTAELVRIPPGTSVKPRGDVHLLGMHVSRPIHADCVAGDMRVSGPQVLGDMDFIPTGTAGSWEDEAECDILRVTLRPELVSRVATDLGRDPARIEFLPCLHFRDPRMEALLWALRADLVSPMSTDALYREHLTGAVVVGLIELASGGTASIDEAGSPGSTERQISRLIRFIDANIEERLGLAELASVAGMSVTRLKVQFRARTGSSVHRYVMRRRVDRARDLLATTSAPASVIALTTGFSHQTHMATAMRRFLGLTPQQIERPGRRRIADAT